MRNARRSLASFWRKRNPIGILFLKLARNYLRRILRGMLNRTAAIENAWLQRARAFAPSIPEAEFLAGPNVCTQKRTSTKDEARIDKNFFQSVKFRTNPSRSVVTYLR